MAAFAELLARSCFSFLEGASHPEELTQRARELGLQAIGLCDRDGLYGSVRMLVASRELEQRVVVGAELTLERPGEEARPYRERPRATIALLVEDHDGYSGLCRLLTRAHATHEKGEAGLSLTEVAAEARGLHAIVPLEARAPLDAGELGLVREAFGERAAIAVWRHLESDDEERLCVALASSARFDLPIVASNRPVYHHRRKKRLADVVACIRLGVTLDQAGTALSPNAEAEVKGAAEMLRLFPHHPEWIDESAAIAERCRFSLGDLRWRFPSEHGDVDVHLDPNERLARAVTVGARDRYPDGVPAGVQQQLDKELGLIAELDVAPYFLSVKHIVDLARERRILCQGRGSAANSAVCFVLGITAVDPARSSLLFERFMSSARSEPPDIDVDFEHERREEVIQEIYRRYGRDRAAMVSEVICYRGKSALREVGKAFGLSNDQLDRLASLGGHYGETDTSRDRLGRRGLDPEDARIRQVVELAGELQGLPRHLSIHVGGFVLSSEPLDRAAPVEPGRMENRTVVPWDKDDIEALGFFKVDVLGLGMLTAIRKSLALVHEKEHGSLEGFDPIAALARIPPEDPAVYDAACRADTVGVFQIESRAQMAMLPILKPRCFYDLVVEVGIVRPGPIQGKMVHPYLRRRTGEEPVTYPHPCLEPILSRTMGVPLFQEQVMQLAIVGAGYAPGEADQLRRDMAAWRKNGRLLRHRDKLVAGFQARGIGGEFADRLFQQILGFGEYGFPECVVGDTLVIDASTGRRVRIEDVVHGRQKLRSTIACDSRLRLRKRRVLAATPSGPREVFRLRTALGREILATAEHPLFTVEGWRPLCSLSPGDHVAAARMLPRIGKKHWPRHQIIALADLVAEGNLCHPTTFYFYTTNPAHRDEYVRMVERFPNTRATVAIHHTCFSVHVRRADRRKPCGALEWAQKLGLRGIGAHDKRLPADVFLLHETDLELLLARLWEGDGHLSVSNHASYDTASKVLAEQVQHLLLRIGIVSRLYERTRPYRESTFTGYTVTVTGNGNLRVFYERVARRFLDRSKRRMAKQLAEPNDGRMSRDIVPTVVRGLIRSARTRAGHSWKQIGNTTKVSMREIQSHGAAKQGFRRWVVARVGRALRSPELVDLGTSDLYWDRVVSIEAVGIRETYDLTIEGDANFLANDFVVHNSHSSSFALLVYASLWLKVHHPAIFAAALVNSQPMGFYSPASIIRDGQKHGVTVRPVRVESSAWDCTLEGDAIRLGFRVLCGFPEAAAAKIVAVRAEKAFGGVDDLMERAGLAKDELELLAEGGALEGLESCRREALWRLRAPREAGLFGGEVIEPEGRAGLAPLSKREQLALDSFTTGISLEDHPMRHMRPLLEGRGVRLASEQQSWRRGEEVTVAGVVLTRQRPMTASGIVFITLEDETGIMNLVLYNDVFERYEMVGRHAGMMLARGPVDRRGPVVHVRAQHLERLEMPPSATAPFLVRSRDFH
jgi:error-prone DNA polymerase